jgi:hypothetical protein
MSGQQPIVMPFSPELQAFLDAHPEVFNSLKLANPTRFAVLTMAIISRLPDGHALSANRVIGITYLDIENLRKGTWPFFKQDFLVWVAADGTFVSYAAANVVSAAASPHVQPIAEFERVYGDGGRFYTRPAPARPLVHHLNDVSDLPPEQQAEAAELKRQFSTPAPVRPLA